MKYRLNYARAYYGPRAVPFTLLAEEGRDDAGIPLEIEGPDDLDIDAIERELAQTVFAKGYDFKVTHHDPEATRRMSAELKAAGVTLKAPMQPSIACVGNGVTLRWVGEAV